MKKFIALIILGLLSVGAIANEVPKSTITYIAPWTPHVDISMAAEYIDPENCGGGHLYRIDLVNDIGAQAKLSTILSAFMAGKQVGLSLGGCVGNRPKIQGIRLYK